MNKIFFLNKTNNRVFGLDILRAMAILFVLIEHSGYLLPKKLRDFNNLFFHDGVTFFFVLSGFLIGDILIRNLEEQKPNLNLLVSFWKRRWLRTIPAYLLVLIIYCLLHLIFEDRQLFWEMRKYFIFSQNIFSPHPDWYPEAWSLSIEEWFYLLVPLIIFLLNLLFRVSIKKSVFLTAAVIIVSVMLFRFIRYKSFEIIDERVWNLYFRKQVITRLDSLMIGVSGATIRFYYKNWWGKYKGSFLVMGIVILILTKFFLPLRFEYHSIYYTVLSFSLISIAVLFILPFLSELKTGHGFVYQSLTTISIISYSMYLLNLRIVQTWIISRIPWSHLTENSLYISLMNYLIYWILVLILSFLLYKYFEAPVTRLRERFK